ncbi:hypothetical protein BV25DRAFT_1915354 [Artomyces pyxidatus]|uniref:Uncharacterized protein n=1 Tax=Artomyces pyxidatus TaxID=48021 RepID=A0ACB8T4J8_9AGAM|nr:hypothetical protein BV25DRAFT_1915354 [Artomyces pyxidatus]
MPRELRPRKARPSYAVLFQDDDQDLQAGPSRLRATEDEDGDADSGSDFAPAEAELEEISDEEDIPEANLEDEEDVDPTPDAGNRDEPVALSTSTAVRASSAKKRKMARNVVNLAPGLSRPSNRQNHSLPLPSLHHRHKAIPIFRRVGRVERLLRPPVLFGENDTVPTNSFTSDQVVTDRMNKAWGYNVGAGPIWEILEDRGWFKEAIEADGEEEKEANRRPKVYQDLLLSDGWAILSAEDAAPYLPTDASATEEGALKPAPPVFCAFGPYAQQTNVEMRTFDVLKLSQLMPESKAHVFNAGAPVWGLDWCPIHPEDRPHCAYRHYLAVAPFPSRSHSPEVGVKLARPFHACIQIWTLSSSPALGSTSSQDTGVMRCEMVVCIDSGPAYELKWCPLPSHDSLENPYSDSHPRRLGLLAGTFQDGSVSIFSVPYPPDLSAAHPQASGPIFVKLPEPIVRLELEETSCWTLDWANSEVIAVGCTNGSIAVYDIGHALRAGKGPETGILPTHYISVHQSAIRALSWVRAPTLSGKGQILTGEDPTVLASGGYDGLECLTDIREPSGNIMNRTRDVINCIPYSQYAGGPITIDHENIIKAYSVSPSMLGRGHTLMEPSGPVWCASTSDYHPQLAIGSADGTCGTTNMLRSTRRGGSVPFLWHKIYQLDYSRTSRTYRMFERFLPQETPDRSTSGPRAPIGTGAWSTEVNVLRVAWNSVGGFGASPLLASATASGLCRVDWLAGRWMKGKVPYERVESMRRETDAMDIDDDEDSS